MVRNWVYNALSVGVLVTSGIVAYMSVSLGKDIRATGEEYVKFSEAKRDVYRDARESIQKIGDDFDRDVDRIMTDFHKRMDEQDAERAKAWAEIDVQQDNIDRMLDGLEAGHKK